MDKLPPYSLEAEQALLGCILLNPVESTAACLEGLSGNGDFYDLRNKTIYRAMLAIHSEGRAADTVTVCQWLKDAGKLDDSGGLEYVSRLPEFTPSAANISHYLAEVSDKHLMRKLIQCCTEHIGMAYDQMGRSAREIVETFERDALALVPGSRDKTAPILTLVNDAMDEIDRMHKRGGQIDGLSTGLIDLDKLTGGLQPGEMTVIAGYPGSGKTSLALNMAERVAIEHKAPVGIFSLEMTARSLVLRMLCARAGVSLRNVREGFLINRDVPKLVVASAKIGNAPLFVEDISDLSIIQLRSKARRMVQQHGIKCFVIDYLQLLNAVGGARAMENRQQEVSDISRGIKGMAKEFNVPVVALSQLNDDGKLRESRAIGQDADNVWVLENEEDGTVEETATAARAVKLVIKKQRNGPSPAVVHLTFLKTITKFESAAKVSQEDVPSPYSD